MNVESRSLYTGDIPYDEESEDLSRDRSEERIVIDFPPIEPSSSPREETSKEKEPKVDPTTSKSIPETKTYVPEVIEEIIEEEPAPSAEREEPGVPTPSVETKEEVDEELLKTPETLNVSETDFYTKPTVLSRLILNQKYGGAIKRLYTVPQEARVWVCAKRKRRGTIPSYEIPMDTYSIRQLPIHLACCNLSRTHDFHMKKLLNELLATLIFAFPAGSHQADHKGRLPICEAVWCGVPADTIALFLMAHPESINVKDRSGRSLTELNKFRPGLMGKTSVQNCLNQSIGFWMKAKAEAKLRLHHNTIAFPSEGKSISSMSVMASSEAEEESLMTSLSRQQPKVGPEEIPAISWEQLERRAITTEQILTEINEENYKLSQKVDALITIDQAQGNELVEELTRLNEENAILNKKLHGIAKLLKNSLRTGDEEQDEQYRLALAEISSLMGLSSDSSLSSAEEPVLQVTKEAKEIHKSLSKKQSKQREQIHKLKYIIGELILKDEERASESEISPLTSHSAKSVYTGSLISHGYHHQDVLDRTPPQPKAPKQIDDLDVILSYAAERDASRRRAFQTPQIPKEADDDLSAMFRWAASKEVRTSGIKRRRSASPSVSSSWSPVTPSPQRRTQPAVPQSPHNRDLELPPLLHPYGSSERVERVGLERVGLALFRTQQQQQQEEEADTRPDTSSSVSHSIDHGEDEKSI